MNCKNCGSPITSDSKFCTKCGAQISENNQSSSNNMYQQPLNELKDNVMFNQNNYQNTNPNINNQNAPNANLPNKETLGTVSLILGIISLVLSYFLNILILPLAIIGLILGIVNKKKHGQKIAGIILNSISIFIIVVMIIIAIFVLKSVGFNEFFSRLYNELDYSSSSNYVAGKYDCTGVDSNTDKYLITLHLNKDNTFLYGPYGDLENNYVKGTYTYEDEHKTNGSGDYKYFMLTMEGKKENFIVDGTPADHDFSSQMEFGITSQNAKKQGVIMFVSTYNMYYCYEN